MIKKGLVNLRIGVDIDGVLNNVGEWHFSLGTKFCLENHINRGFNPRKYYMEDQFYLTDEENKEFWRQYIFDLLIAIPPRPFASEILHRLRKDGHTIVILTARDNQYLLNQYEGMIDFYIKEWLSKYNMEYDEIITGSLDKKQKCLQAKLDLMIEDKESNINKIKEMIPVFVFDAPYNQNCIGENIVRVYTWYQIYQEILNRFNDIEIL